MSVSSYGVGIGIEKDVYGIWTVPEESDGYCVFRNDIDSDPDFDHSRNER